MKSLFGDDLAVELKQRKATEPPAPPVFVPKTSEPGRLAAFLGKCDDLHECADESCLSRCHDIADDAGGRWLIQCAFCGTSQWVDAIPGIIKKPAAPEVFEFPSATGERFPGMTIEDVLEQKSGVQYVAWAAKHHHDPAVRTACQNHLDSIHAAP